LSRAFTIYWLHSSKLLKVDDVVLLFANRTSTYTVDEDFTGADRIVPSLGEPGDAEVIHLADLRALL